MPLLRIIGSKRVWIALFASIIAVIALCALGAWAIVRGFLQPDSSAAWLCGSFALAGLLAGWIAGGKGDGILLRAVLRRERPRSRQEGGDGNPDPTDHSS